MQGFCLEAICELQSREGYPKRAWKSCWLKLKEIGVWEAEVVNISGKDYREEGAVQRKSSRNLYRSAAWVISWISTCVCLGYNAMTPGIKNFKEKNDYWGSINWITPRAHAGSKIVWLPTIQSADTYINSWVITLVDPRGAMI